LIDIDFPFLAAILISGYVPVSHLFGETSFELAIVENVAFTDKISIFFNLYLFFTTTLVNKDYQ